MTMKSEAKVSQKWARQVDYIKRLNDEELEYLRNFESEYYGLGKSDGTEASREGFARGNRLKRDALNRFKIVSIDENKTG